MPDEVDERRFAVGAGDFERGLEVGEDLLRIWETPHNDKAGCNLHQRIAAGIEAERRDGVVASGEGGKKCEGVVNPASAEEDLREQHDGEGEDGSRWDGVGESAADERRHQVVEDDGGAEDEQECGLPVCVESQRGDGKPGDDRSAAEVRGDLVADEGNGEKAEEEGVGVEEQGWAPEREDDFVSCKLKSFRLSA